MSAGGAGGAGGAPAGVHWIVEAFDCDAGALRDRRRLAALFDRMIAELGLHPVSPAVWHEFPAAGGVTGLVMLSESHLACHTFPEHRSLCLDLFCCVPRARWDFEGALHDAVGAGTVRVRRIDRAYHDSGAAVEMARA